MNRLEGFSPASEWPPVRSAAQVLRRFWSVRQATAALESVFGLCFIVIMMGGVFEIVNTLFVNDVLDRAAHAVARNEALQDPAATNDKLIERAREAIRAEVGDMLDPALLSIGIDVYDDPSKMLLGESSQGEYSQLGGDAGEMVVVRLSFRSQTPLGWMQQQVLASYRTFQAVAMARNEIAAGLPETAESTTTEESTTET